jgi:hypothetical protein
MIKNLDSRASKEECQYILVPLHAAIETES